jgi:hypothetical protein
MEDKLLETLNGYRDAARELRQTAVSESFDDELPEEVQTALIRMVAAMSLDERLEKCEAFLSEESPEEINEAFFEAQEGIGRVLNDAFLEVEKSVRLSPELENRIGLLSVNTESSGLADDLLKLYKCEGIIRMAYSSAQKFSIYGAPDQVIRMEEEDGEEAISDQERYIMEKTGVDICALMEVRARLIGDIQREMGETAL